MKSHGVGLSMPETLSLLNQSLDSEYYDEVKDKADQETYYKDIAESLGAVERYHALNDLLRKTHEPLGYDDARRLLYSGVDHQQNGKLRSVYSDQEFDPEALIREDFHIADELLGRLRGRLASGAFTGLDTLKKEIALQEAEAPYNCEHVVPQSWFGHDNPMKGDMHHLFTCEQRCNSFRNHYPYYEFKDYESVIKDKCGKLEEARFEPEMGKGVVARATLYFILRYRGLINDSPNEYQLEGVQTLLGWNDEYEVGFYEKHRNMWIFMRQGNRNPLIDRPDWASQIDFGLGLG